MTALLHVIDRPRPEDRIFSRHPATWRKARVGVSVLADVHEILRAVVQGALAHLVLRRRRTQRPMSLGEIVHHR